MAVQASFSVNSLCFSRGLSSRPKPILSPHLQKITGGNAKGCFVVQSTISKHQEIARPLANFPPDIWGDHFLNLHFDNSEFESCSKQVEVLKALAKDMLVASASDPTENICLIHTLCRLGVSYHFESEIQKILDHHFATLSEVIDHNKDHDLHRIAVIFQVFRFHGYNISSDVFNKFKDENGKFKVSDIKGILSLYEATQFRTNADVILDEALAFTKVQLEDSMVSQSINPHLTEYIQNALNRPYLKDVERLEAREFICFYERVESRNDTLLKFAKYDFNRIQMLHQEELKVLCSRWNETNMVSKFPYVRHRIVESYFTAAGFYFEPRYARARYIYTISVQLWAFMDDTYDAYGTFEELQCFTDAMKSFDRTAMDNLPADYLKLLYGTILDFHDEVEETVRKEGRSFAVSYLRNEFTKTAEAHFEQARWVHEGYQPKFDEYLETEMTSAGANLTMSQVLAGMEETDDNDYRCVVNADNIIYKVLNLHARLYNDLATNEAEEKRGLVTGRICYMKQYGVSREEAIEAYHKMIEAGLKELNEGFLRPTPIPRHIINRVVNYQRLLDTAYKTNDGYSKPETCLKDTITKMFILPIPL